MTGCSDHGALFRLGLWRVPDAPDVPGDPRDYEEAAMLEGASIPVLIRHVLLAAGGGLGWSPVGIVSVTAHWERVSVAADGRLAAVARS